MKYNLCNKNWILLIGEDGNTYATGLADAFLTLDKYISFGGEIRLQDTAMLRLFAAAAVTMIYRYDISGVLNEVADEDALMERYREIFETGHFPEEMVHAYFRQWSDQFFLIGGEHPFYQVPLSKLAKEVRNEGKKSEKILYGLPGKDGKLRYMNYKDVSSINGLILESGNKVAAYADISGHNKKSMSYAEAARWLIWYMAYADCGTKSPSKWESQMTFASMGANIYPIGKNLFETVMLNSVLLNNGQECYEKVTPAWEREASLIVQDDPYGEAAPQNLPELYTQQSRRIMLKDGGDSITGIYVIAGDKYSAVNAFIEPMFLWKPDSNDRSGMTMNTVKYNTTSSWNNLRNVLLTSTTSRAVRWIKRLEDDEILDAENIPYIMSGITYGSMQSSVDKMLSDRVVVSPEFFNDSLKTDDMRKLIEKINALSQIFYQYGCRLAIAEGADKKTNARIRGKYVQEMFESNGERILRQYLQNKKNKKEVKEDLSKICMDLINNEMEKTSTNAFCNIKDGMSAVDAELIARSQICGKMKEGW